ncbi:HD-like signal output (HDOD) domain, no enzymatic activity [Atopomonas hussainii]|uniref:HD-like signal output (HDOD) domain, no enzymatic activity n=1 Tax=Atopomonas hussainii TaxID=1429083 RepID=A0A1H7FCB3_9GAMM|nr:HDOD domain-containing protein [Atopomonas hussainii]SEK23608.1 HD-like signal output (HDOD) domain, no enzymatic activity [Atopomonas hussainii]
MQVLIADADPWAADLLKVMLLKLRPDADVQLCQLASEARDFIGEFRTDLLLCEWQLPDASGLNLLHALHAKHPQLKVVMVGAQVDRSSLTQAKRDGLSDFISKPLEVVRVMRRLEPLLGQAEDYSPAPAVERFPNYLRRLLDNQLELPINQPLVELLERCQEPDKQALQDLFNLAQADPALTSYLLRVANSAAYTRGEECTDLRNAVLRLGIAHSLNLALGQALRHSCTLSQPLLAPYGVQLWQQAEQLAELALRLAETCHIPGEACYTAALLHCIGELTVLQQAQRWLDDGNPLPAEALHEALEECSRPFAARLKVQWRLPLALRELIAAVYFLDERQVGRDRRIMHTAGCLLRLPGIDNPDEQLPRLLSMLGLSQAEATRLREPSA